MPAIGWTVPFSWDVARGAALVLTPWSDGWYVRCQGSDGERKLHAFDEKPDLVTSIPDLDGRAPRRSTSTSLTALPSAFSVDGTLPATRAVKVAPNALLQKARSPCFNLWSVSDRCNQRALLLTLVYFAALMANLNNIIRLRRSADVFHKLAGHALVDYERGCEDFAIQYFQMRESFPSNDFTQFFEDPESIKAIETLFKRLNITYETALAKYRERHPEPSVSYRPVAPEMLPDADPQQAEIPFYTRPGPDEMLYTTCNTFKPLADSSSRASRAVFEQNATDEDYKMTILPPTIAASGSTPEGPALVSPRVVPS
ncbi:hypothetical protein B0H13DRAFT_2390655 [Mycena leptocephala]|nr:hypothetical protein B0H13DRAFT_2390655 [Mycena leptocephala]